MQCINMYLLEAIRIEKKIDFKILGLNNPPKKFGKVFFFLIVSLFLHDIKLKSVHVGIVAIPEQANHKIKIRNPPVQCKDK